MLTTALAPCSPACCSISSKASSRVLSHRLVSNVMLPPIMVCSAAPRLPITLRDLTIIPRTIPRFRTIRYPGSSKAVVTMAVSTRPGICFPPWETFTGAILPAQPGECEPSAFVMVNPHGNDLLPSCDRPDLDGFVHDLARPAVAGVHAPPGAHRSGLLRAARSSPLPMQRNGAGARAQSGRADGIRSQKL